MASTADAKAGWEIFRDADYALTRNEINSALVARGFAPVAERTYRHYGKLQRYGYTRYVPINQLDVKTLRDPFMDQSSRAREHPIQTATPVQLRMLDGNELVTFSGVSVELSTSEAVVRLRGEEAASFFAKLETTSPYGELIFQATGEIRRGRVERLTLDVAQQLSTVRMNFDQSMDVVALMPDLDEDVVEVAIRIGTEAQLDLRLASRHMYWLSQAADAARSAVDELSINTEHLNRVGLRQPVIRDIRVGSLEVVIGTSVSTAGLLYLGFKAVLSLRSDYWSSEKSKQEATRLRWANDRAGVEWRSKPHQLTQRIIALLQSAEPSSGESAARPSREAVDTASKVIDNQVMPAIERIVDLADGDVTIDVEGAPEVLAELGEAQSETGSDS